MSDAAGLALVGAGIGERRRDVTTDARHELT